MLYTRQINVTTFTKEQIEQAIRKIALKRNRSLDFISSSSLTGIADKRFLGLEGQTQTSFTRIRHPGEHLLPKFIIDFPKSDKDQFYILRLSKISFVAISFLTLPFLTALVLALVNFKEIDLLGVLEGISVLILLQVIFVFLCWIEIKLTIKTINKTISNFNNN